MHRCLVKKPDGVTTPEEIHRYVWSFFRTEDTHEVEDGAPFLFHDLGNGKIMVHSKVPPEVKEDLLDARKVAVKISKGKFYRFKLRGNPAKRSRETGKRVSIHEEDEILDWLERKLAPAGKTVHAWISAKGGQISFKKIGRKSGMVVTLNPVDFEGVIECENSDEMMKLFVEGVGSAKGYGMGLLMMAPCVDPNVEHIE